ncbi:Ribosomal protein methyltransferase [Arachis hypogaea]|nr:Ribosomal protein methyltransferase [Arachis hypogaea]
MARYEVKIIEEDDWMKGARESFHPVKVTEGLWVVPKWITPPVRISHTYFFVTVYLSFSLQIICC